MEDSGEDTMPKAGATSIFCIRRVPWERPHFLTALPTEPFCRSFSITRNFFRQGTARSRRGPTSNLAPEPHYARFSSLESLAPVDILREIYEWLRHLSFIAERTSRLRDFANMAAPIARVQVLASRHHVVQSAVALPLAREL